MMADGDSSPTGGLGDLFSQLQAAQADLEAQAAAIEAAVVEGHAAGGAVVIRLTGALEAESVHIDPSLVDPGRPESARGRRARGPAGRPRPGSSSSTVSPLEGSGRAALRRARSTSARIVGNLDLGGMLGGVDVNAPHGEPQAWAARSRRRSGWATARARRRDRGDDDDDGDPAEIGGADDEPEV